MGMRSVATFFKLMFRDFIFECVDGRVPAQRHLLYVSSEYFRRQLDRNPTLSSHFLSYPKKLVAALVGYVHTLTFAFPESMRLEDVEPFLRLLDYFVLRRPDNAKLVSAAEMWMAEYLDKASHRPSVTVTNLTL